MDRKNMLDFVLDSRMEDVAKLSEYDLEFMKQKIDEDHSFDNIMNYVESLNLSAEIKNALSDMLFDFEGNISEQFAYFNEKYYKYGFSDAVNIIFDALEYEKTGEN